MPNLFRQFARLHPLQRAAAVVWVALLLGVTGRVLVAPARSHTVVPIYLTAAEKWQAGGPLYDEVPKMDIYRNPPGIAAAFVPLTWLPERLAGLAWRGLGAAVFLVGLAGWARHGLPRPLSSGETGAVFLLAAVLAVPSVNNGQTNMVIIGALLLGATAAARLPAVWFDGAAPAGPRGRWAFAAVGGWLAVAASVKVYPAAVGLLVGLVDRRRIYPWFFAGCGAFFLAPYLIRDADYVTGEYENFVIHVTADDRTWAALTRAPQDLFLAVRVWVGPPYVGAYLVAKLAAAAGFAGLVALVARRTGNPRVVVPLGFHLGCVWVTVLGPATEVQTYILLGPTAAAVAVLAAADRRAAGGPARFALAAGGYGLMVLPIVRDTFPNGKPFHALALPPIGGALVLASVVWSAARVVRAGAAAAPADAPAVGFMTPTSVRTAPCLLDRVA